MRVAGGCGGEHRQGPVVAGYPIVRWVRCPGAWRRLMDVWFFVTQDNRIIQRVETEVTREYVEKNHPYLYSHYVEPLIDDRQQQLPLG